MVRRATRPSVDAVAKLAGDLARAPIALGKMTYDAQTDNVIYRSKMRLGLKKRRRAAGLRLDRRWVPVAGPRATQPFSDHRILDARSLALHALIARKIARDPSLLKVARRNLGRWRATRGIEPPALAEWRAILARPWSHVATTLTDMSENAVELRHSSPFAGILSAAERARLYAAFRV